MIQKASCKVFAGKNAQGVNAASYIERQIFKPLKDRTKQAGAAVDREHPKGGLSHQAQVSFLEGTKGGKGDFKAPSYEPAFQKIFKKCFHHNISMRKKEWNYTGKK